MYLAGLYQRLQARGAPCSTTTSPSWRSWAGYDTVNRSIMMAGASGMERKDRIMRWLRETPPATLGGQTVRAHLRLLGRAGLRPAGQRERAAAPQRGPAVTDRFVITVRPSGTEPKLKFYCQLLPERRPVRAPAATRCWPSCAPRRKRAARAIYNDLLAPLGVKLGEVGLLLTDLIELDRKRELESETLPRLREELARGELGGPGELAAWLRRETAALLPGADALPALRGPLALLVERWGRELPPSPGLERLRALLGGQSHERRP